MEINATYEPVELASGYNFEGNGRNTDGLSLLNIYNKVDLTSDGCDQINLLKNRDQWMGDAIEKQLTYLTRTNWRKQVTKVDSLAISNVDLKKSAELMRRWLSQDEALICELFETYQLKGEDELGNVHFTGYYTPVIEARKKRDAQFKYPIYRYPVQWKNGTLPSREEIDGQGALAKMGLELAWTASILDNYFMQVQGSGYLQYPNGRLEFLSYAGKNGHPYVSIGKHLVKTGAIPSKDISLNAIKSWIVDNPDSLESLLYRNPSYVFFENVQKAPTGASGVTLSPNHSIAVDPDVIPWGSILLAEVPILDEQGKLENHEYRILLAQDRGSAINGAGHVDLYCGIGEFGQQLSGSLHHYGRMWLLLPK
ncbi:MAG: murein transglycosylase A [Bacteroidota bacterium]